METVPVPVSKTPTEYERKVLREIHRWKNPKVGWLGKTVGKFNRRLHGLTDLVRKVPGVDWTIDNVVSGLLRLTNEIMQDSVWHEAIFQEYQKAGHDVRSTDDIRRLDLEAIDQAVRGLDTKYRSVTGAQGAAAGFAGAAGVLPDVLGLVALNLRAAGEYATYCGYDINQPSERLYALQILHVVSQPPDTKDDPDRETALVPASSVSHAIAQQQTVQTIEQMAVSGSIRGIAKALGTRLTKVKLAQLIPMAGAFVGGGFNVYYTTRVCEAAYHLYRERWLLEKYGPNVLFWQPPLDTD